MYLTIVALILRILSNPLGNVFQKKISSKSSSLYTNFYTYFILSICCIPFAVQINWSSLSYQCWFYAIVAGLLCAVGNACLIKALQMGELSVLGPINSYKSIVGMIVAFFLLHEIPSIAGFVGVLLIIWGSWFVFDTQKEGFSLKLFKRKDIQLRFLALIMMGIEAVLLKKVIMLSSVMISFMLWCFTGAIFAFVLVMLIKHKLDFIKRDEISKYFVVCSSLGTMQISTNYVFKNMDVGLALALFQLSMLVTLFFGYKFFHETDMKKKIIGTVIMIVGSVLIILLG